MGLFFFKNTTLFFLSLVLFNTFSCTGQTNLPQTQSASFVETLPVVGANQTEKYLPLLSGKKIGVVANQTSVIFKKDSHAHLVDSLVSLAITIEKVFAPEHGFRGTADAGEIIKDGKDVKTGIPIISLYGKNKKPTQSQLAGLDLVIFDIQDVGARFYTYISTLHYVLEACAEAGIPVLILDRPNPNIHYIDGPVLEPTHASFVGMHPIPVVHGMTIAEYAKMIVGENWLEKNLQCEIQVISVARYTRNTPYSLPVKPSPNLVNDTAVNLYPSTCFFEGTTLTEGRGTENPFVIFGAPYLPKETYTFSFTPKPNEGSKNPKFNGKLCYGMDLSHESKQSSINLQWLIDAYIASGKRPDFFTPFFTTLAGTTELQKQIERGDSFSDIQKSWKNGLVVFEKLRKPYLIYE